MDIESFVRALDENPNDTDTRRIYADLLEEHGDFDGAATQRWMVDYEKAPFFLKTQNEWAWSLHEIGTELTWELEDLIYSCLQGKKQQNMKWVIYTSRTEAEEDLRVALRIAGDSAIKNLDRMYTDLKREVGNGIWDS